MFEIEMLPARHGDALWLRYGDPAKPHHVLIDGGPRSKATTRAVSDLIGQVAGELDLVVVTHIDADHITGVLAIMEDDSVALRPADVWFNAYQHLREDLLGAKQGEELSKALVSRKLPWNKAFGGDAVCVADDEPLPEVKLPGGLKLTLLSPTRTELAALVPVWEKEVAAAGMVPGQGAIEPEESDLLGPVGPLDPDELVKEKFKSDDSEANGASMAFLAEFDGKSVLLTGDAHAGVLEAGLRRLAEQRGVEKVRVDAFKLPHHGSRYNLSSDLLDVLECDRYLVSTNGSTKSRHPDPVAISRIVARRENAVIEFNYRSETTTPWEASSLQFEYDYTTVYPLDGASGLTVVLS
jgi:beta-lactamase superfamily II metal-dependent hydrolase